jgi:hypothetical protein
MGLQLCSAITLAVFNRKSGKRAEEHLDNKIDSPREGTYACVSIARLSVKADVSDSPRIRGNPRWQIRLPPNAATVACRSITKAQHALRNS